LLLFKILIIVEFARQIFKNYNKNVSKYPFHW